MTTISGPDALKLRPGDYLLVAEKTLVVVIAKPKRNAGRPVMIPVRNVHGKDPNARNLQAGAIRMRQVGWAADD